MIVPPGEVLSIAVLGYPGVDELDLFGAYAVLSKAAQLAGPQRTAVRITAAETELTASSGVRFAVQAGLDFLRAADAVVVPGGRGAARIGPASDQAAALRTAANRGARVYAVCTGALIVAAAGLAAGRRVAVHHAKRDLLGGYPVGEVARGLVVDGPIATVGGDRASSTKSVDLALRLVADLLPEVLEALYARLEVTAGRGAEMIGALR